MKQLLIGIFLLIPGLSLAQESSAKFEPLYHKAKELQGGLAIGTNYVKFGELLQGVSTEILISRDKATTQREKELVDLYADGLSAYGASAVLWGEKIKLAAKDGGNILFGISNRADLQQERTEWTYNPALKNLVDKYELQKFVAQVTAPSGMPQDVKYLRSEEAIQGVWIKAGTLLEIANQAYLTGKLPVKSTQPKP